MKIMKTVDLTISIIRFHYNTVCHVVSHQINKIIPYPVQNDRTQLAYKRWQCGRAYLWGCVALVDEHVDEALGQLGAVVVDVGAHGTRVGHARLQPPRTQPAVQRNDLVPSRGESMREGAQPVVADVAHSTRVSHTRLQPPRTQPAVRKR